MVIADSKNSPLIVTKSLDHVVMLKRWASTSQTIFLSLGIHNITMLHSSAVPEMQNI
jgi:hypothetical protein